MKRFLSALVVFLLLAGVGFGQSLQFELAGDGQLSIRAKAQDQRWILLGGRILVAAVVDGKLQVEEFTWTAKPYPPQPGPNPPDPGPTPPEPNPPNPPPPPPPDTKWQVAIFVESNDLDNLSPSQKTLLASLLIRKELSEKGHYLVGVFDPEAAQTITDEALKPWINAVKGKKLPLLLLAPKGGGEIKAYPLPDSSFEFWKLLENPPAQPPKPSLPARCLGGRCFR